MSHLMSSTLRYQPCTSSKNPETSNCPTKDLRKNASVASYDSDAMLSHDSSRGIITCGVKIRKISTNRLTIDDNRKILTPFSQQKPTHKDRFANFTMEKDRDIDNIRLPFKRTDSSEMESTKTDSPRVSSFAETANRLNAMKLSTEPSRFQQSGKTHKITMESLLLQDRERLQKLVKQKLSQIFQLNKTLNEERKSSQSKIRQLELEIQMNKYTHQQMTVNFNLKLEAFKKQNASKDSLITQLTKEVKELQILKAQHSLELSKQKQSQRKDFEQLKYKLSKVQKDYNCSNKVIQMMRQQNVKLLAEIKTLNAKIDQNRLSQSTHSKVLLEAESNRTMRVHKLATKDDFSPRRSYSVIRVDKREEESSAKRQMIQDLRKTVKKLEQSQRKFRHQNRTLQDLLTEANAQLMKERVRLANKQFNKRY